jgi:ferredoxin
MKVWVDPGRCCGHARCVALAPEAFEYLDMEDRSVVRDGAVDNVGISVLREAESECPERAIMVEAGEGDLR